jgi:hypothetical protein
MSVRAAAAVRAAAVAMTAVLVLGQAGSAAGGRVAPAKIVPPDFASSTFTDAGQATPRQFQVADFNGDGHQDVAEGLFSRDGVNVLLGDGDGHFSAPVVTPLPVSGGSAYWLAAGDFDLDGRQDLAELGFNDSGAEFRILLGKGNGHFSVGRSLEPVQGRIVAGDLNEDGRPDLVVDDTETNDRQEVWLNRGDGRFRHAHDYGFSGDDVRLADLNGDGHLDLLWSFGRMLVRLGTGRGTFGQLIDNVDPGHRLSGDDFTVADFDEDGIPDVAMDTASAGKIQVGLGDGAGHFRPFREYADLAYETISIAAADFTGDGHVDLVTSGDFNFGGVEDVFTMLQGRGDGTFGRTTRWVAGGHALTVGEFNEDGKPDLVSDNDYRLFTFVTLNAGGGFFRVPQAYTTEAVSTIMRSGDLDGDGRPDLVFPFAGSLESHLNDNGKAFGPARVTTGANGDFLSLALGDLNGDGTLDAVGGSFSPGNIEPFLGDGSGLFAAAPVRNNGSNSAVLSLAIGDVTSDGKPDVISNTVGQLSILPGKGNGRFGAALHSGQAGPNQEATLLDDFAGDAETDVVSVVRLGSADDADTAVFVNRGHGDGSFDVVQRVDVDTNASSAAAGDLNGDGRPDLAVVGAGGSHTGRTGLFVFLNGPSGFEASPAFYGAGETDVALADFNLDGALDIATTCILPDCPDNAQFAVYAGDGSGTLRGPELFLPAHFSYRVAAGLFTADRKPDIVLLTPSSPRSEFALYVNTTDVPGSGLRPARTEG